MRHLIIILVMSLTLIQCSTMTSNFTNKPGHNKARLKKVIKKEIEIDYLIHLPQDYTEKKDSYPLLVFLHGAGERGDNLTLVKKWGPPRIVEKQSDFPYILISPQCPKNEWWTSNTQMENLYILIQSIIKNYRVDEARVYLTGMSMGGYGTWAMACEYPDLFAAIAPVCGGGQPILTRKITDIPTWVFHGAKDQVVPISESEKMVTALKENNGNVKFTVFPNAGHNSWSQAYNDTNLLKWFLNHQK